MNHPRRAFGSQPPKTCPSSPTALISVLSAVSTALSAVSTTSSGSSWCADCLRAGGMRLSRRRWQAGPCRARCAAHARSWGQATPAGSSLDSRVSCPRARSSAAEQETLNLSVVGSSPTGLTRSVPSSGLFRRLPDPIEGGRGIDRADQPRTDPARPRGRGPHRTAVSADDLSPPGGGPRRSRRLRARARA